MKRFLLLLALLTSTLLSNAQVFRTMVVSGQLVSTNPNIPLGNIVVSLADSSANSPGGSAVTTITNANGFFSDTLMVRGVVGGVYAWVADCNNNMLTQMTPYSQSTQSLTFTFNYCAGSTTGCNANFTYNISGQNVTFQATNPNPTAGYSYFWSFGNGTSGVGATINRTFNPGTYNVCLMLTGPNGCSDTVCQSLTIGAFTYPLFGSITGPSSNQNNTVEVILYQLPSWTGVDTVLAYPDSANGGYLYSFPAQLSGQYTVMAQLAAGSTQFSDYLPTYYGNIGAWQLAQSFNVGPNTPNPPYSIAMLSFPIMPSGPGNIGGTILRGNWRVSSGVLKNVRVQLRNNANQIVKSTLTNASGNFNFTNLPWGSYSVMVDWGGRGMTPYAVTLSNTQTTVNNIFVTVNQGSITTNVSNESLTISRVYPNPVMEVLNIELQTKQAERWTLEVLDLSGRVVIRHSQQVSAGTNIINLDAGDWSKGLYLLQGTSESGNKWTTKLVK